MIEDLPPFISLCFVLITISTLGFYLYAVWRERRAGVAAHAGALVFILVVQSYLALSGFYLVASMPPRFFLTLFPSTAVLLTLYFWPGRKPVSPETLRVLTLLSVIRVPIEVILLWLFKEGHIPQLMTFDGRNFDILSGLSAPIVALIGFRHGKVNRPVLIAWNLLAMGLLLNIVINAILSLETPFQQFAFDEPNRALLYFPFIWLPAVIVPIVFVSHIASLWQLVFSSDLETSRPSADSEIAERVDGALNS